MRYALLLVFLSATAWSQTVVTAQVQDGNGDLYVNCSYSLNFVGQNTTPGAGPYLANGQSVFQQSFGGRCDSSANMSVTLTANTNISPTPSQWQFNICSTSGLVGGPYCFTVLVTITGTSQDVTSNLSAVAPVIPQTGSINLASPPKIGNVTPNQGSFTSLSATSFTDTGAATLSGATSITGPASMTDLYNLDTVLIVDGTHYATTQAAYNALPSTGGTVVWPPNYSETLAGNFSFTKPNSGILALGPATITMGNFQILRASGIYNNYIKGMVPGSLFSTGRSVVFTYTGNGFAFVIGDSSAVGADFEVSNLACDISANANANSGCFDFIQLGRFKMDGVGGFGAGGTTQIGILLDGTGSATSDGVIMNSWQGSMGTCIKFGSGGSSPANSNVVVGGECAITGGLHGMDFESGSNGNTVLNYDIEACTGSCTSAINMGGTNFGNRISIYGQGNTLDYNLGASTKNNIVDNVGTLCGTTVITVTDNGTSNSVMNPCAYKLDIGGNIVIAGSVTANGAFQPGSSTLAALPAYPNGTVVRCSNCNNVVDDSATAGALCSSTGTPHGAEAFRVNGKWVCM